MFFFFLLLCKSFSNFSWCYTVSTLDASSTKWLKTTEPIIMKDSVYTGQQQTDAQFYFWWILSTCITSDMKGEMNLQQSICQNLALICYGETQHNNVHIRCFQSLALASDIKGCGL